MKRTNAIRGFTLIELLIVVAIITLLLAILLPSLHRAIYSTQLVSCASNIRQNTLSALNYASDNLGAYPLRMISHKPNSLIRKNVDDRPLLKNYFDLEKVINCPLLEPVDFVNTNPDEMEAAYNMFFGYGYKDEDRMSRVGSRWTFQGQSFNLIVSDRDVIELNGEYVHGTHPDRDGVMYNEALNQAPVDNGTGNFTLSRWINYGRSDRGLIDMNFGYDDGSVQQMTNLEREDDRLTPVPEFATGWAFPIAPTFVTNPR